MAPKQAVKVASAVFGGLAVGLAFLAGLIVINAGRGFEGCTATTAIGWMLPVMAGLVVGGVAWLLLNDEDEEGFDGVSRTARCADCGRPLAAEWRLCPYCGSMTRRAETEPVVTVQDRGLEPPASS